jgi:hypothetical protein
VPAIFTGMFLLGLLLPVSASLADYFTQVSGHGTGIDAYTYGGFGTLSLSWEDNGRYDGFDFDQILVNKAWANVGKGRMGAGLWGTTIVSPDAPQRRGGPIGTANAWTVDYFTIAPGQSGLNQGDPVQILFFTELNGRIVLYGIPSGAHQTSYKAQLWKGSTFLSELDYTTGGIYPPQNFSINERVLEVIDVKIGDRLRIDARLYNWMNGSAHDPGTTETDYLDFCSSAIARIGYAPGYENILITSDANTPIEIPKPDLVITDIWEQNGVIYYQILNDSIVFCPKDHTTFLQVNGQIVDSDTIPFILAPGERFNRAFANSMWNCSPPDDTITVTADVQNAVAESDEQNNSREEIWKCDNNPPQITSGPTVSQLTSSGATISWTTDENSDGVLKYSDYAAIYDRQELDGQTGMSHQIVLKNLSPSTTYHFIIESSDESNNKVTSGEAFFQTAATASGADPNITLLSRVGSGFPLPFRVDLEDKSLVERVEFFFDGMHVETDYSAPYECLFNPFYLGMEVDELPGNHTVLAEAYNRDDRTGMMAAGWEYGGCLSEMTDLELQYPHNGHWIYTDTDVAPAEDVDLIVYAVRWPSLASVLGSRRFRGPRGGGWYIDPVPELIPTEDLEFLMDGDPITVTDHGPWMEPYVENVRRYTFNAAGLEVGRHPIRVRTLTEGGCYITDVDSIYVERNEPELEIARHVIRDGHHFDIILQVTNNGTIAVTLDRISDTLTGFQGVNKDTATYDIECSYTTLSRKCAVEIDFSTDPANTLNAGQNLTVSFVAVPVLYQGIDAYEIGGEGELAYHDPYDSYVDPFTTESWADSTGLDIYRSVDRAFAESDFLIVTNPQALFRLHLDNQVNLLLSKAAEFAGLDERQGVLGYFYAYPSIFTGFEGQGLMAVGDLLDDSKDEIIVIDRDCYDANDRIRVFNAHRQISIDGGVLPRDLGTDAVFLNDVLVAGDVIDREGASLHPRDEIILIDGHSAPGAGRGDVTVYQLRNDNNNFDVSTCHVDYAPGEFVAVGNVIDVSGWDGDEILVAHNDGTIDLWGGLASEHASTSTIYGAGDHLSVGNVLGNYLDEIVILKSPENRVYVYDLSSTGSGPDLIFDAPSGACSISVGDITGNYMKEIVIADYAGDLVHIYDYHGDKDSTPTILRWHLDDFRELDDWLYVADVMKGGADEVLVAHGAATGSRLKGSIDILHTSVDWVGYDSRFALDELINEHGDWAERLAPGWCVNGYLLIVGENSIIPAFTSMYSDDSTWWASLTDNYYASTEGSNPDVPEISVGRIIGDNPRNLREAIETCISMAQGDFALDNSNAYLLAGSGCEGWFETHTREIIDDILIPKGFSTTFEKSFGPAAITDTDFFNHTPDNDIIHIYAHGSVDGTAGILDTTKVTNNFDPCSVRPLVCAFWSCDTGRYSEGKCLAESFIEKGASAYFGATSRSDGGGANRIAREFYSNLGPSVPIGRALRDAKYQVVNESGDGSTVRKYNCAVNHLYGDPKMTMSGWGMGEAKANPEFTENSESQSPPSNIQINIPDYKVTETGGEDRVTIPGGGELIVTGKPIVPIYSYSISLPPDYQVRNVSLTQTGGLTEDMGLNIPESDGNYPVSEPNYDGLSVQGEGWWPLEEFEWHVVACPNDASKLVINIYPFFYKSRTTASRFFKTYDFDINYSVSGIEINRLRTDKGLYHPGETVGIDMYLYNPTGQSVDIIVEGVIKRYDSSIVSGLGLRTLRSVSGVASYSMKWDSSNYGPGDYLAEVTIRNVNSSLLDRKQVYFSVGEKSASIIGFEVNPVCYGSGDDVSIIAIIKNNGDINISGSLVIKIEDMNGVQLEEYRHDFNELQPDDMIPYKVAWQSGGERYNYRISAFALYEGKSTETEIFPKAGAYENGDFNSDGIINFADFTVLAQYWQLNFADADIAPPGGDCMVDYIDLSVLAMNWLDETWP